MFLYISLINVEKCATWKSEEKEMHIFLWKLAAHLIQIHDINFQTGEFLLF